MDLERIYHDINNQQCNILEMVKREPEWAANRLQSGENEVKWLRADALRMALRLYGENPDTFSPETREVMDRWKPICEEVLSGVKCTCLSDHPDYCQVHAA